MNKELSQILHLLEKMKKDTKKRGLGSKKFEEGYDNEKQFKKEIKNLRYTLCIAKSSILNTKESVSIAYNVFYGICT